MFIVIARVKIIKPTYILFLLLQLLKKSYWITRNTCIAKSHKGLAGGRNQGKTSQDKRYVWWKGKQNRKRPKTKAAIFQQQEWTKVNKSSLAVSQSRLLDHHMKLENEQKYDNKYIHIFIFRVKVSCTPSVDGIILWVLIWLVNYVVMLLVVCQLSRDVIGYEDS